jgi:ABC-type dipeptide/oligopeptide/nickel transport system permease component
MVAALLLRQARRILLTVLLGGLLGATLVRLGPGFGVDEREPDTRLSADSQQAIRLERARDNNIASFYFRYLAGLARGDFGFSRSLNRPVSELLKERLPLTMVSLDTEWWLAFPSVWRWLCSPSGGAHPAPISCLPFSAASAWRFRRR